MAQSQAAPALGPADKRRSHGFLGGVAGALFGFFIGLDLVLFGVVPFNSALPFVLTVLGLVGGILWGRWAPLGGRGRATAAAAAPAATAPPAPPAAPAPEEAPESTPEI